ncbi:MAG: aminodeoxychorismate/anthranilate synthase component II [Bacteroidales bacterium]|nr:aminodeoxychorismate/anthranilate synthase component II [Bacteroidales bacterium]
MPKRTLLIDNHDSFTYNLLHLLTTCIPTGGVVDVIENKRVQTEALINYDHVVLSPGPGVPKETDCLLEIIHSTIELGIPLLGVCLGHQAIAEYYGAKLFRLSKPAHGEISQLKINKTSRLLYNVEDGSVVTRYHSWAIDKSTLPEEVQIVAHCEDGIVMSIEHKTLPIFGLQFHPESFMTRCGSTIIKNFYATAY